MLLASKLLYMNFEIISDNVVPLSQISSTIRIFLSLDISSTSYNLT